MKLIDFHTKDVRNAMKRAWHGYGYTKGLEVSGTPSRFVGAYSALLQMRKAANGPAKSHLIQRAINHMREMMDADLQDNLDRAIKMLDAPSVEFDQLNEALAEAQTYLGLDSLSMPDPSGSPLLWARGCIPLTEIKG